MELTIDQSDLISEIPFIPDSNTSTSKPFIEANTSEMWLGEIRDHHIIPVFIKDNEPTISQADFIESTSEMLSDVYNGECILKPSIRVSHPVKGRIPDARSKPANELLEHEKTLYYERMAFVIEVPSVCQQIQGNNLTLVAGGVKSYNLDNLYSKKGADEHFKVFIGFQNSVCTNLCVWTDGFKSDLKVTSVGQLKGAVRDLFSRYNGAQHLHHLEKLLEQSLTEEQFARLIGRCRMYNYLPADKRRDIPPMLLSDTQIGSIVRDYYRDHSFCRDESGNINLWRLYNLFTGANKTSYIDTFLDRSVNAYSFIENLKWALDGRSTSWYLN